MNEYRLKFAGVKDLIIVSPKVLETFIPLVYRSGGKELVVDVEVLMPENYSDYLMKIINTNRGIKGFEYKSICADVVAKKHIYQILQYQFRALMIEKEKCFCHVCLEDKQINGAGLDVECKEPFYWACKDSKSVFWYVNECGRQIKLVVEYENG